MPSKLSESAMELDNTAGRNARTSLDTPIREDDDEVQADGGHERSEEDERLLGGGKIQVSSSRKQGWISILGFALPKPLLYLFLIPPILSIFSYIFHVTPTSFVSLPTVSNGTHLFHPTTLLISLDGFRPSYLTSHPHLVQNLLALGNSSLGLRAESMQPRFPTLTFPNHWSIMTGLYPESHGIIANDFWEPTFGKHFEYTKEEKSWDPDWWWGEPMWSVAQRGGRTAANIMWPGPPVTAKGIAPSLFVPYRKMTPNDKLNQVLAWLDMPLNTRPQLITTYVPNIDQMGHKGGPTSSEVEGALELVDHFIGNLVESLAQRNLSEIINVVIVSDHGMTSTANERLVYLDDILGEEGYKDIEHKDGWPSVGLRFKEGSPVEEYLQILLDAADESDGSFAVYTRETMPQRWHFNATNRIAPIYVVPKLGWAITDNHEHKVIHKGDYNPKGNHGYDNTEPDMQAIFFAHGPFARSLKVASRKRANKEKRWVSTDPHVMQSFSNLEVFSLVMRLMGLQGIEPAHNGTKGFWDEYLD